MTKERGRRAIAEKETKLSREMRPSTALVLYSGGIENSEPGSEPLPFAVEPTGSDATLEDLVFCQVVKDTFKEEQEKADEYWQLMRDLKYRRIDPREALTRVEDLFGGHRVLILGFNTFLPERYQIALPKKPKVDYKQFKDLINKVRMRLQGDDQAYCTFLEKVQVHSIKSIVEIYQEAADLLNNKHADLVEEFSYFLPHHICALFPGLRVTPASRVQDESIGKYPVRHSPPLHQEEIVGKKIVSSCCEMNHRAKYNTRGETRRKESEGDGTQDKSKSSNLANGSWRMETAGKEKKDYSLTLGETNTAMKAASEGNDKDCEDSLTRLHHKRKSAEQVVRPLKKRVTKQSEAEKQSCGRPQGTLGTERVERVFHDSQISNTLSSEYSSLKETKDQCDDDRYELDMLIRRAASTARKVAELVEYIEGPQFRPEMSIFTLEDHLSAINLRCIQGIYGDFGLEFIDQIRENPAKALPVVLSRLKQKHDEWYQVRIQIEEVWAEEYSKKIAKSR